jgi:glutamyl-tRNA reductase
VTRRESLAQLQLCGWPTASLPAGELASITEKARAHGADAVILESCQRIEVYRSALCECEAPTRKRGADALRHLAEVATGLHSVVLGEAQILGQVRSAFADAHGPLRRQAAIALAAARELRRETAFTSHSGHLLDRGLERAGMGAQGAVLVIGAGQVGRLVAERALQLGFDDVVVAARRPAELRQRFAPRVRLIPLDQMASQPAFEIAIGCLGSGAAPREVATELPPIRKLILDLGTPPNFAGTSEVPLLTIAVLRDAPHGTAHGDHTRATHRARLHEILERRLAMEADDGQSAVGRLRGYVEAARLRETQRIARLHPEIPEETIETITRSFVNQLFHTPSRRLKELGESDASRVFISLFEPAEAAPEGAR